ncbi:MAG TPA: hypothetical protein VJ399_01050, partial [Patescibacteria group bacterium]|nr:hypothetical protein [Patescibacteria group bacterium]
MKKKKRVNIKVKKTSKSVVKPNFENIKKTNTKRKRFDGLVFSRKRIFRKIFSKRLLVAAILFLILFGCGFWLFWGVPLPTNLVKTQVPVSTKLYDRNGKIIYEIYTDKRST